MVWGRVDCSPRKDLKTRRPNRLELEVKKREKEEKVTKALIGVKLPVR